MKKLGSSSGNSSQNRLLKLLTTGFRDVHQACNLLDEFLANKSYNKSFFVKLLGVAKQRTKVTWKVRRLATLMLEHQILKLDPNNLPEFDFILTKLNLKPATGPTGRILNSLLKEGYSSTELRAFIPEFRRKLGRLNHVHDKIKGRRTTNAALLDFIELSSHHCKLSVARYLFTPEEIVDEILGQVQVTEGLKDLDVSQPPFIEAEIINALNSLPDFEAEILKRLCESSNIYWVSEDTSSAINSLVEYPTTTVVLVIKPPGSDIEFEIKRAGRRGPNSLSVVYERNGYTVAPSHRLDGGSMLWLLRYEAQGASRLGLIHRLVHGTAAPIPQYISRSTIYAVPARSVEVKALTYFTEPEVFGDGFREMREAMKESVAAFAEEGHTKLPEHPGDLAITAQFFGQVTPAQAILCGTSSFRLDKLATYLSSEGPDWYFKDGLKVGYSKDDARRFADTILEEVLGSYQPPDVRYRSYDRYLDAAFCVSANRERADRVYLSLVQQIAKFWGTVMGVRGHSRGESFVARNVGLKTCWDSGQWKVKIIFMDHDALAVPDSSEAHFYPESGIPTMEIDEGYIWGRSSEKQFAVSELGYLRRIYKIGDDLEAEGRILAQVALKEAYRKTHHELLTNQKLRSVFNREFLERLLVWDTLVEGYLQMNGDKTATTKWKREMKRMLATKGYRKGAFDAIVETIEKNKPFLERYSYLFQLNGMKEGRKGSAAVRA